jgi:hypothetical protein
VDASRGAGEAIGVDNFTAQRSADERSQSRDKENPKRLPGTENPGWLGHDELQRSRNGGILRAITTTRQKSKGSPIDLQTQSPYLCQSRENQRLTEAACRKSATAGEFWHISLEKLDTFPRNQTAAGGFIAGARGGLT